eukprot:gene29596-30042_t
MAAAYAGFSERRNVWGAFLISGALAGLAGVGEVAGPIGQLQPSVSPGYGFAAIIVAYVGRLHPLGVVLASLLMSLLYIGGESVQIELQLPNAITGLFQGLLLFYLLAADLFIHYRFKPRKRATATAGAATPLVFASVGELVAERSGVLNLGLEGMMLVGAVVGFSVTLGTGSAGIGLVAAMAAGMAMALLFAFLVLTLQTNQVAT